MSTSEGSQRPPQKRKRTSKAAQDESDVHDYAPTAAATQTVTSTTTTPVVPTPPAGSPAISDPAAAPAVPNPIEQLLPPPLLHLKTKYCFASMSILTSAKIEAKVATLLKHLARFSFADTGTKPGVVAVHARGAAVPKLVTVVEIAKRRMEQEGGKWWQCTRLDGQKVEQKEKPRKENGAEEARAAVRKKWAGDEEQEQTADREADEAEPVEEQMTDSQDDGGFQTQAWTGPAKLPERPKVKTVPTMVIYMSRVPVPEFEDALGYAGKTLCLPLLLTAWCRHQTNAGRR